ncbi:MAG: lactonase family protein [Lachnospiraceae bacterium]|nr:lactonase family protein [Lachnospiraceae bacterium]
MSSDKYVAYVSKYTMGNKLGIKIFDVDMEKGRFYPKDEVEITNSSYLTISHNRKYLYSITDFGVEAYKIAPDGQLEVLNEASINGMRGCYLSTDYNDKLLFVAGYHDGKLTVLRLNEDGSIAGITDEIYHRGMGSIAERNFRPHVNCARVTKDNKYLCVADIGMDHVKVYKVDHRKGTLKLVDVVRSEPESAPRHIKYSEDGRFMYVVHELKNYIDVYHYYEVKDIPYFDKIQTISTLNDYHSGNSAASALNFSEDYRYMISSNAGDNSVVIYEQNKETGLLTKLLCLPINGSYPKDATLFPDNKHLVSLNHESNTLTFLTVDLEKKIIVLNGPEIPCDKPNTVIFHKLPKEE